MNNLLHQLYMVFHDPLPQLHHQTMSQSKLEKGDAVFSTQKHVPDWDINTLTMMLQLSEHHLQSLQILLSTMQSKRRISKHTWRRMLGTLRSMALALYGAEHLFSILQHALWQTPGSRIHLHPLFKSILSDWLHLATMIHNHPVSLVPTCPTVIGTTGTSKLGMGGFWLPVNDTSAI
jgi:hypothetical protein